MHISCRRLREIIGEEVGYGLRLLVEGVEQEKKDRILKAYRAGQLGGLSNRLNPGGSDDDWEKSPPTKDCWSDWGHGMSQDDLRNCKCTSCEDLRCKLELAEDILDEYSDSLIDALDSNGLRNARRKLASLVDDATSDGMRPPRDFCISTRPAPGGRRPTYCTEIGMDYPFETTDACLPKAQHFKR